MNERMDERVNEWMDEWTKVKNDDYKMIKW